MTTLSARARRAIRRAVTEEGAAVELIDALETDVGGEVTAEAFEELEDRVDDVEASATILSGRVDTAETDITALEGRVDVVEPDVTSLDGRVTALEAAVIPIVTAWGNFSTNPTLINNTTGVELPSYTVNFAKFKRSGDSAFIKFKATSNVARSTLNEDISFKLNQFTIDTDKNPVGSNAGTFVWFDPTGPTFQTGELLVVSASEIAFQPDDVPDPIEVADWDDTDTFSLRIDELAISGWNVDS